jgi:tetratricopeptide (TPR) repeat protein
VRGFAGHTREYGELGEEVDRLSIEIADPVLRMAALPGLMHSRYDLGRLSESLALAEEGIALGAEDPALGRGLVGLTCPYAFSLFQKSIILCLMGQFEESASELDRALRVAQEQGDLELQAFTHISYVSLAYYTEPNEAMLDHATQADEIAERVGSAQLRVWTLYSLGLVRWMRGETDEGIAALERSKELARESRTGLEHEALRAAVLAEVLLSAGQRSRALETAEESVALALQRGNEAALPMCHRVLAEALLASEDPGKIAAAQEELQEATAAVEATGARAELPFIERARQKLIPVS